MLIRWRIRNSAIGIAAAACLPPLLLCVRACVWFTHAKDTLIDCVFGRRRHLTVARPTVVYIGFLVIIFVRLPIF